MQVTLLYFLKSFGYQYRPVSPYVHVSNICCNILFVDLDLALLELASCTSWSLTFHLADTLPLVYNTLKAQGQIVRSVQMTRTNNMAQVFLAWAPAFYCCHRQLRESFISRMRVFSGRFGFMMMKNGMEEWSSFHQYLHVMITKTKQYHLCTSSVKLTATTRRNIVAFLVITFQVLV